MKLRCTLLGFVMSITLFGQKSANQVVNFESNVNAVKVVPFNGIVLVEESKKISAYDPIKQNILWSKPLDDSKASTKALNYLTGTSDYFSKSADNYTPIESTPFIQKVYKEKLMVVNSFDGETLFNPEDNLNYYDADFLIEENALLAKALDGEKLYIVKYDLKNKSTIWKTEVSSDFSQKLSKFNNVIDGMPEDSLVTTKDRYYLTSGYQLFALNKEGKLLWKHDDSPVIGIYNTKADDYILVNYMPAKFTLSSKSYLDLKNTDTGKSIWPEAIKTKSVVFFEDWGDKMLLAYEKGFNFYNYATGEKVWKKDPKGKGIKSVIPIDKNFLYVYDDEMMMVDENGEKVWKGDVKICDDEEDPIIFINKTTNNRILYITATFTNMVDYNSGKKVWSGNLKLNEKRSTFAEFDEVSGDYIIYNDEKLYRFNQNTDDKPKPFAKLKLKNEKAIRDMSIIDGVISIVGVQDAVGLSTNGEVLYQHQYSQPGQTGRTLGKIGLGVASVGSSILSTQLTAMDSEGNKLGTVSVFGDKLQKLGELGYLTSEYSSSVINSRYQKMHSANKFVILFAKGESGEKLLVRINRVTGEEVDKLIVQDNHPMYSVDVANDVIYYVKENALNVFNVN